MDQWMKGAKHVNFTSFRGNGPFNRYLGVILHVNVDEHGTSDAFYRSNPSSVTPNFQVYKDGTIHQYLPFNWQPWCQINGNFNYAAIETAGLPNEPLTKQQVASIVKILREYKKMGFSPRLANHPGEKGLGTHKMGGAAWGGHECPGSIRTAQRAGILYSVQHPIGSVIRPRPQPTRPVKHVPVLHAKWTLPAGHYYGLVTGPAQSHGGFYASEKPVIKLIQQRLQVLRMAPQGAGWADGVFENPTRVAVANFQRHYFPKHKADGKLKKDEFIRLLTY